MRATQNITWESFFISEKGPVRSSNQDAWGEIPEGPCYFIADGMGGHRAGEVAAWELAACLNQYVPSMLRSLSYSDVVPDDVFLRVQALLQTVNERIYRMAKAEPCYQGMGTTVCLLFPLGEWTFFAHVGDSRIYHSQDGKLSCLTKDQVSIVERPKGSGRRVRVLSQAIGVRSSVQPLVGCLPSKPGGLFLLCTDGLTDHLSRADLQSTLCSRNSLAEKGQELASKALARGGRDNITMALVQFMGDQEEGEN